MPNILFNRTLPTLGSVIEQPSMDEIKSTPQLWNAGLEDAMLYGGDLTREALSAMNIRGDYRNIVVDTKVHMLMPGMFPAIPGWHTDGVPRGADLHPQSKGAPMIWAQEERRSPRFHLLVTGEGALTDFCFKENLELDLPPGYDHSLYTTISESMEALEHSWDRDGSYYVRPVPSCTVAEWDWWNLHTARAATKFEWRYLIRVTETDEQSPQTDLRQIMRTQSNVYVPTDKFGW